MTTPRALMLTCLLFAAALRADDDSVGTHGMALVSVGQQLIASHMPLHGGMHGHQLLLALRAESAEDQAAVLALVSDSALASLLPERLSLTALRNGGVRSFKATVFRGHFERQGAPELRDVVFVVEDRLLDRPLGSQESGDYYWIPLGNVDGLLVHRIGSPPSFDHIVSVSKPAGRTLPELLDRPAASPLDAGSSADWLDELGLSWRQELYLETADFAAPR